MRAGDPYAFANEQAGANSQAGGEAIGGRSDGRATARMRSSGGFLGRGDVSIHRLTCSAAALATTLALAMIVGAQTVSAQAVPIQLTVGDTTTLLLDGTPSTGARWVLEKPAAETARLVAVDVRGYVSKEPQPGERPAVGAQRTFQVLVTGIAPGKGLLAFKSVREGMPTPAARKEFAIEVLDEAVKAPATDDTPVLPDDARDPTSEPITDTPKDMFADPDAD